MKKSKFVDFAEKALLALLCLASVALILFGFVYGAGWSAFGVVLFAPALIAAVCYVYRPIEGDSESSTGTSTISKAA